MWSLALSLCTALVVTQSVSDRFAPYRGRPVLAVEIESPVGDEPTALKELIDIQPGYLLSQNDVEAAQKRLYALGRFAQVEVYAERVSGVVILHFRLLPVRRLGTLEIVGTHYVNTDRLLQALKFGPGDQVEGQTAEHLQARAEAYLAKAGFPHPEVTVRAVDDDDVTLLNYVITVHEGEPRRVAQVRFIGSPGLPPDALHELIRVAPNSIFDAEAVDEDREALRRAYIDHGYLKVRVGKARTRLTPTGVDVALPIDAGPRVDIEFAGNTVFSDNSLRQMWPETSGALTSSTLATFRQRLASQYLRAGYTDATVNMRGFRDPARNIERYLYVIDEHRPVEVLSIDFVGVQAFDESLLREQVRAILRRDLTDTNFFEHLQSTERGLMEGARVTAPPMQIAPEQRWVPDLYQEAIDDMASAYRDVGYLSAEVMPAELVRDDQGQVCASMTLAKARMRCLVHVRITVQEGPQTFIQNIAFSGNTVLRGDELLDAVYAATLGKELTAPITPGGPLSASGVEDARIGIIRRYRDQGYLYVRVFTQIDPTANPTWSTVSFRVEEGPQVHIQRILVRGNRFTRESIIRSRMTLMPGDLYRLEQAVKDQRSIGSLGVFSSVRVKLIDEEHAAENKDLVADVVERSRQPVEIVPGLSTANGPRLRVSYSHLNVAGTASAFTASLKVNRQVFFTFYGVYANSFAERFSAYQGFEQIAKALDHEVRVGMRSPPVKALPFDPLFRIDLVNLRVNALRYALDTTALIAGVDAKIPEHFKVSYEAQVGTTDLECITSLDPNCDQNPELRRLQSQPFDVGQRWTFKTGPIVAWDWRDNPLNPSRGIYTSVRAAYAFGSARPNTTTAYMPFVFTKFEGNITGYVPLFGPVMALSARAGTINLATGQVPIDERFFLGGRDTMRGYVESAIVPQDACLVPDGGFKPVSCAEALSPLVNPDGSISPPLSPGGNTYVLFKAELRLPIRENLTFDIFLDMGNLWVDIGRSMFVLRTGTGVGLRYATPVGALAIDFGINPWPRAIWGEPNTQLHFSIGAF